MVYSLGPKPGPDHAFVLTYFEKVNLISPDDPASKKSRYRNKTKTRKYCRRFG